MEDARLPGQRRELRPGLRVVRLALPACSNKQFSIFECNMLAAYLMRQPVRLGGRQNKTGQAMSTHCMAQPQCPGNLSCAMLYRSVHSPMSRSSSCCGLACLASQPSSSTASSRAGSSVDDLADPNRRRACGSRRGRGCCSAFSRRLAASCIPAAAKYWRLSWRRSC